MIFGSLEHFAVESIIEPGPEFRPVFGSNVVGRMRLFLNGMAVGNFAEPNCVLRPVSQHLVALCAASTTLWHSSLANLTPAQQFEILDAAIFVGTEENPPWNFSLCSFLTNVSEAFDPLKAFLLCRDPGEMQVLLQRRPDGTVEHFAIARSAFCSVASEFATWVSAQEKDLIPRGP